MQIKSSNASGAIGALRSYLLSENYQQFQNPRDPTSVNVLSAFSKYDTDKSGYITIDSLRQICDDISSPITDTEIDLLIKECSPLGDGRIDYVGFAKYLLAEHIPLDIEGTYESTTQDNFSPIPSEVKNQFTSRPRSGKPTLANQPKTTEPIIDDSDIDWSNKFGTNFQTGTHFEFGNFRERPKSVYQQDINCEDRSTRPSCPIAVPLPDSKIFPSDKSLRPQTTNRSVFKAPLSGDVDLTPNKQDTSINRGRDRMDSVVLSDGLQQLSLTETQLNFNIPKNPEHSSSLAPPPTSVQMLSQQPAMERPEEYTIKQTEAQRTFRSPQSLDKDIIQRQRAETARTNSRLKDNRKTHFEFGSSCSPNASEMTCQFMGYPPDYNTAPAGASNLPTSHFSVFPREKTNNSSADDTLILENKLKRAASAKHVNPRDPVNLNLRKAFLEFDKDLGGRIAPQDIVDICYQQGINITEKDLQDLMDRCDHDKDGMIDYHDFSQFLTTQHNAFQRQENTSESTTKRDFNPIEDRHISEQKERINAEVKKRYTPSAASHYFHMDHERKPTISATRQHFQHPLSHESTS
ncbi:hypothetical protein LOD99_254 [Oopsacas minuta]|uniref:EF-hand domain-containing protein n=1 Tax=Oopsacas minuta TaxID=111878 RepID=A0AAV7K8E9_9METZ|nr:hypothetical protein LOD99_254 [Oopsacas minuta]